jgi:hypothetical protein
MTRFLIVLLGLTALAVAVGLAALTVKYAPEWLADTSGLTPAQQSAERGRIRTALLALLAGTLAAIGAAYTARTFALNRRGQITERFTAAVELLGQDALAIRIGGIYALERLARESPLEHAAVMDVLAAYVRQHSPWPQTRCGPAPPATADVQAVVTVLSRRARRHVGRERPLEFSATNLSGVRADDLDLRTAHLANARLDGVILVHSDFRKANLNGASFRGAQLLRADLRAAHVGETDFRDANLSEALLGGARYDRGTQWPVGFEPDHLGAVRLDAFPTSQPDTSCS